MYRTVRIFGGGKPWRISGGSSNFTAQILTTSHDINKESKQMVIHQSFTHQKFLMKNSSSFPPSKIHTTQYGMAL